MKKNETVIVKTYEDGKEKGKKFVNNAVRLGNYFLDLGPGKVIGYEEIARFVKDEDMSFPKMYRLIKETKDYLLGHERTLRNFSGRNGSSGGYCLANEWQSTFQWAKNVKRFLHAGVMVKKTRCLVSEKYLPSAFQAVLPKTAKAQELAEQVFEKFIPIHRELQLEVKKQDKTNPKIKKI